MSNTRKEVANFYDNFSSQQKRTGVNIRHRTIFKNLIKAGLQPTSNVLEIGCGIGTVTGLIAKFVSSGKIVAVDISPQSIELAKKQHRSARNIEFLVSDMSDFKHKLKFDFVVLPDVLEHIPVEQHRNLFKVIKEHTHIGSTVVINIPNPPYLRWLHKNKPGQLQVIDQPLSTDQLLNNVYENDFYLYSLNVYSTSIKEGEYQSIILRRPRDYEIPSATPLSKLTRSFLEIKSKS